MKSIRWALIKNLLFGVNILILAAGLILYLHVRAEINELYHAQLQQIAQYAKQHFTHSRDSTRTNPTPTPHDLPEKIGPWEEEDFLIQLWSANGELEDTLSPVEINKTIPLAANEGFSRLGVEEETWRVYRTNDKNFIVQVAQPESALRETIRETTLRLVAPLLMLIPLLFFVLWLGVRTGLKPINVLSSAIDQRSPHSLVPIELGGQPQELHGLVRTLNALLLQLRQALTQQRDFIANAAHELRTPVAALRLQLELYQRSTPPSPEASENYAQLDAGIARITHLINQLLDFAKSETHEQPGQRAYTRIAIQDFIPLAVERHIALARAKNIDIGVVHLDSCFILASQEDLDLVLDNLLSNAVKHSFEHGEIDIAVEDAGATISLSIADNGPGIPEGERSRVFDRFYRILRADPNGRAITGSGLGLAIVKSVCDRYGATLSIADRQTSGQSGAVFTLRWPKEPND